MISPVRSSNKAHSPSSLYYDYTENFATQDDGDNGPSYGDHSAADFISSSPSRQAEELSDAAQIMTSNDNTFDEATMIATLASNFEPSPVLTNKESEDLAINARVENSHVPGPYPESLRTIDEDDAWDVQELDCRRNTTIVRHSGLGYLTRELSTHIEEADRISAHPSPEVQEQSLPPGSYDVGEVASSRGLALGSRQWSVLSSRSSAQSLGTRLQKFPKPPIQDPVSTCSEHQDTEQAQDNLDQNTANCVTERVTSGQHNISFARGDFQDRTGLGQVTPQQNAISQDDVSVDSSRLCFNSNSNSSQKPENHHGQLSGTRNVKEATSFSSIPTQPARVQPHFEQGLDVGRSILSIPPRMTSLNHEILRYLNSTTATNHNNDVAGVSIFSSNIPKIPPRPSSPMLAPKAISPARQLRLKNSVPQLMKALPPLPMTRRNNQIGISPHRSLRSQASMPELSGAKPSPHWKNHRTDHTKHSLERQDFREPVTPTAWTRNVFPSNDDPDTMPTEVVIDKVARDAAFPLQRLRLRTRRSSKAPLSKIESRPWNSEESYPWTADNLVLVATRESGHSTEHVSIPQLPRFQVKVTRGPSSSQETMVVNRESAEVCNCHDPIFASKDLFTPPAVDLASYFQDSRGPSHPSIKSAVVYEAQHTSAQSTENITPATTGMVAARHVRIFSTPRAQSSFSDDSSNLMKRSKLKTRLSNLKTKISFQHSSSRSSSSGNDHHYSIDQPGSALRSASTAVNSFYAPVSNPKVRQESSSGHSDKGMTGRRGFRVKIRSLFKGARNAITHRKKKSKTSVEKGD